MEELHVEPTLYKLLLSQEKQEKLPQENLPREKFP